MATCVALATRPVVLEPYFGGMDRVYKHHKWSGIVAATVVAPMASAVTPATRNAMSRRLTLRWWACCRSSPPPSRW